MASAGWLRTLILVGLVVVGGNLLALRLGPVGYELALGERNGGAAVGPGFYEAEQSDLGVTYRWTADEALLTLRGPMTRAPVRLTVQLGGVPPGAEVPRAALLSLDEVPWTTLSAVEIPRQHHLLVPAGTLARGTFRLGFSSTTTVVPPDPRPLGVRVDRVRLVWPAQQWLLPAPVLLVTQMSLLMLWLVVAQWLGVHRTWFTQREATGVAQGRSASWQHLVGPAIAGLMAVGLFTHTTLELWVAAPWQLRLLGGSIVATLMVWAAGQLVPRLQPGLSADMLRLLLLITFAALIVRLLGVLYPLFGGHDFYLHDRWMTLVQLGNLIIYDSPSEFGGRLVRVSPTIYTLLMPTTLLGGNRLAMQYVPALLEGTTPLVVGLLALRFGQSERTAVIAAALIAMLPIQFTALYWGFVSQIVGQWLALVLLLVLAGALPTGRVARWWIGLLVTIIFLIHPGVLLLLGTCLGLVMVTEFIVWQRHSGLPWQQRWRDEALAWWRGWLVILVGAGLVALTVQYADTARLMLAGVMHGTPEATGAAPPDPAGIYRQIWVGLNASFAPLPLVLVGIGAGFLLWRTQARARRIVGAWLGSAIIFLLVDLITWQQVRYGYFSVALVCIGIAALLTPLSRSWPGRLLIWGILLFVSGAGLWLWFAAIALGVKPSVNPLTH